MDPSERASVLGVLIAESGEPPAELFHYTSAEALLGIVSQRSVWATNFHFLNDSSELQLCLSLAREALNELGSEGWPMEVVGLLRGGVDGIGHPGIYVTSFSEHSDQLSQWRAYSPRSSGFGLGFRSRILKEAARARGFRLVRCVYDPEMQQRIVREWAQAAILALSQDLDSGIENVNSSATVLSLVMALIARAPMLKHHAFREEAEWRLVCDYLAFEGADVSFRPASGLVVPYVEVPLVAGAVDAISALVIGPHRQPSLAALGLERLREAHSLPVPLLCSEAPFREL